MELKVNGRYITIDPLPGEMLADLLRNRLGLTGTKIGCNEAECGTCTVLVDGLPILSCNYPAVKAEGRSILTIEGLAACANPIASGNDLGEENYFPTLHPLQRTFIAHGAVQCGFCIPGMIMTSYALLQSNPNPSSADIRHALKDTLCRCAGYPAIERAIMSASAILRGETEIEAGKIALSLPGQPVVQNQSDQETLTVIGTHQARPDAVEKVTGRAIYTDDISFPGMVHARVKRAGVPHAILRQIDTSKACALPGVLAVLTADDLPAERMHGLVIPDWPILVGVNERVRTVGDAVALVAAETRAIASEALDLIEAIYDQQPVVAGALEALHPGAPALHPGGNLLKHIQVRKGDVKAGLSAADIVLEHTFHTSITEHAFLEPECSVARPTADGRMEIYVGSQIPYADRNQVARALGWPDERVRVIGQLIGGGFGGKEDIAGQIHAALLAQATGRPVKLLFDRHESMLVHPKRHATQIRVQIGARSNGQLTAVETELYGDTGAYASLGEKVMTRATTHSSGPYEIPNVKADCFAVYTNNPPAGAFRGFGVTQSAFAIESMMDELAQRLRMDPIDLRRMNALRVGSVTNTGQILRDSVGLLECIQRVTDELQRIAGNEPFLPRLVDGKPDHVRAWGFALAYKNTGLGGGAPDKAGAEVEIYENGALEVRTASAELGQGLVTVLQMIVAEEFQAPIDRVRVLVMDTDLTPDGGPTTASRQTYVTGNAARHAAQVLRQVITTTLAEQYDVPPEEITFREGLVQVGEKQIGFGEVHAALLAEGRPPRVFYEYWAPETRPLGQGGDMHFAYAFAAQAVEVEVNCISGEVHVLRVIAANDVGKVINPLGLQGQVEGGIMMGIGNVLTENFIVDQGRVITDRMARYRIPSIMLTPEIFSIIVEHPTVEGPYGAKGIGEIVSIPTTPAITNAIFNATGVRIDHLPVDQEEIVRQLVRIAV
jgi:xanthine dehydrogenase molybdenum-binding subunit